MRLPQSRQVFGVFPTDARKSYGGADAGEDQEHRDGGAASVAVRAIARITTRTQSGEILRAFRKFHTPAEAAELEVFVVHGSWNPRGGRNPPDVFMKKNGGGTETTGVLTHQRFIVSRQALPA
jgi:hypothetical protein